MSFGFSIFEFNKTEDGKTLATYYMAQQVPGHAWGKGIAAFAKRRLNSPSFVRGFMHLKGNIENNI